MEENLKATDSLQIKTGKGFNEGLYSDVNMHLQLFDAEGRLKEERFHHNTVTAVGKTMIADQLLASPTIGKPTHMAIGTGAPAANALGTESGRVAFTSKTRSGAVVTMVGDFPAGTGTGAITEAGTFNAPSAGDSLTTASFAAINKLAGDSLSITWTLTIS